MTSIICPKCKSHISEYDLICLNCGYSITQEEREKLVKEVLDSQESVEENAAHQQALKHQHELKIEKKLNKVSLGFFKVGFAEMVVPLVIILLIIIVAVIMLL